MIRNINLKHKMVLTKLNTNYSIPVPLVPLPQYTSFVVH